MATRRKLTSCLNDLGSFSFLKQKITKKIKAIMSEGITGINLSVKVNLKVKR